MSIDILVDSDAFRAALEHDLPGARRYAYLQALSFEGDATGLAVADLLARAPASDRRVVVDCFTRHVVSDHWVWHPENLLDADLRSEERRTRRMFDDLVARGVAVRFTNPVGPLYLRMPARNHKKLVLLDDRVAYIGGINFSDHNFAWHDMMVRIEDPAVAGFLREDFLSTWGGRSRARTARVGGLTLHALDGASNEDRFEEVLSLVSAARERIFVETPYLTHPFGDALRDAARRGVAVSVVTPDRNNWALAGDYVRSLGSQPGLEVRFHRGMTHLKAMLVDGKALVLGSANFDLWSYGFQQEYLAVFTDLAVIAAFERRVVAPDLNASAPAPPSAERRWPRRKLLALEALARAVLKPRSWSTRGRGPASIESSEPGRPGPPAHVAGGMRQAVGRSRG